MTSISVLTPTPTPYRISTITFNGDLNVYLRRELFFHNASMALTPGDVGFVWMECWMNGTQNIRGIFPKKKTQSKAKRSTDTTEKTAPKNKSFDNQISMYYRFRPDYIPHVKLFKNGNIHITGLRSVEDGMVILEKTKMEMETIYKEHPKLLVGDASAGTKDESIGDISKLVITNPIVRLINSDFQIPFKIRRKELHQMLIAPPYNTICSFQPGTYPGVKLEYYWNILNNQKDGCCRCATPCFGKKHAHNNGQCKKVTVAIFDSGSILITGATSHEQVKDAYQYICKVIMDNSDYLKKNIPVLV